VLLGWDQTKTGMAVPGLMQMRLCTGLEWPQARDRLCAWTQISGLGLFGYRQRLTKDED